MLAPVIVHKPCVFNRQVGATRESCTRMTAISSRNLEGCCEINCTSPLRLCKVCVVQSKDPQTVINPLTGLCEFHTKNGSEARRPIRVDPFWERNKRVGFLPPTVKRAPSLAENTALLKTKPADPIPPKQKLSKPKKEPIEKCTSTSSTLVIQKEEIVPAKAETIPDPPALVTDLSVKADAARVTAHLKKESVYLITATKTFALARRNMLCHAATSAKAAATLEEKTREVRASLETLLATLT